MPMTQLMNHDPSLSSGMHWYVMLHLEPRHIERLLQQENEWRRQRGLRLFEYFIPYLFLPKAVPDKYAKDASRQTVLATESNDLRAALHNYVFIRATSHEISTLVEQPWNRDGRLHLYFYRSRYGRRIIMPDKMMTPFVTICCENRQRFTFGDPVVDIQAQDTVVIRTGTFKDTEAKVLDVHQTAGGISMTLGIPFFNGEKMLTLYDCKPSDSHLARSVETLLNDRFIDNVESQLLTILYHRMKRISQEEDVATLNHLYHYSYVRMSDVPSHLRFRAMMLICATLRNDVEGRESLIAELNSLLDGTLEPTTPEQAYLLAALYIATANVDCRTAAKRYWQQHPQPSGPLSRLMPLVTRLNRQTFKSFNATVHL